VQVSERTSSRVPDIWEEPIGSVGGELTIDLGKLTPEPADLASAFTADEQSQGILAGIGWIRLRPDRFVSSHRAWRKARPGQLSRLCCRGGFR